MIQGQYASSGHQPLAHVPERSRLLQQHPVLLPFLLLCGSVGAGIASFFSSALFPLLAFTGLPVGTLCLALACVLGIAGLLTGITGILEHIDRHCFKAAIGLKPKEQSYGN
ncbi:MAG TPA: hypothetical protein VFQ30_01880 [Ktedonobacteraceae bacterium]|nr:hypothetical protein [Ktedonobacteraceae bacterium]